VAVDREKPRHLECYQAAEAVSTEQIWTFGLLSA
jgi:hypothetical protein